MLFPNGEGKCWNEAGGLSTHLDKVFNYGNSFITDRGTDSF